MAVWADEQTVRAWRRVRRVGRIWLLIGVACLVAAVGYIDLSSGHADALVAHGVKTTGVVLAEPPQALRCGQVPVPVRFLANGQPEVHTFFVDGCSGGGLSEGERVTVWYERDNPGDFVVNGEPNEAPLPTLLAIVGLVAGSFFTGGFAIRARRLHVLRTVLRRHDWSTRSAHVASYPSPWIRGRRAVRLLDDEQAPILVTSPRAGNEPASGSRVEVRVAGIGEGPYALAFGATPTLLYARVPRCDVSRRRALRALAIPSPRETLTST
jgi:hypothetical protein